MKTAQLAMLASVAAAPLFAQDQRELDAHAHGVSIVEIGVEDGRVEIDIYSPGADIVGFEYAASTAADKDAVEAAIRTMLTPENVVTLPEAAGCRLTEVLADLHTGDDDHDDHGADDHGDDDHGDDAAPDAAAGDAEGEEDAEGEAHGDGDGEAHDDAADDGATHSEFHASYAFACDQPEALTSIAFPFFDQFPNAQEIEAQYVTGSGSGSAEIGRDDAELTLD